MNWTIFRLQRHSDHHMNAYKLYSTLDLTEKMPRMPTDFNTANLFAPIHPLWYKMMNPYVDNIIEGKKLKKATNSCLKHLQI